MSWKEASRSYLPFTLADGKTVYLFRQMISGIVPMDNGICTIFTPGNSFVVKGTSDDLISQIEDD